MTSNNCGFDLCTFWNTVFGGLFGVVLGVIAAIITNKITTRRFKRGLKEKFGKAEGTYKGYRYKSTDEKANEICEYKKEQSSASREIDFSKQVSTAIITYEGDNVLGISVVNEKEKPDDEEFIWEGTMTLEVPGSGTVVWRYLKPLREQHQFGFKRCIIRVEKEEVYVYIIEEIIKGYGKEVFIRPNKQSLNQ